MKSEVIRTKNFVSDAAKFIVGLGQESLAKRNQFRIALSGGNTPRPVYAEIAKGNDSLSWEKVIFTFGDERCVAPDDAQSNYRMARECLFQPANIPDTSIRRMRGEIEPEMAAKEYQDTLASLATESGEKIYRHDLILLGMGDDGHTASLFPGTVALSETERPVVANFVPKFDSFRLTFTFPLINQARHVCFLIDGRKHADLIERVVGGDLQFPAARVNPTAGSLTWILGQ